MRLSSGLALLVAVGVFGFPARADACSCMSFGPPCQAYWKTHAVFDATVVDVGPTITPEPVAGDPHPMSLRRITVDVHRSWKGASTGRLDITTGPEESACGYTFKKGERYLVFAFHGRNGHLQTSICTLTQPYTGAAPALRFLASLEAPARGGRVFGTVKSSPSHLGRSHTEAATETTVRLSGASGEQSMTAAGGRYEFTGLPAGSYSVDVAAPKGYGPGGRKSVEIVDPRGCAEANYTFAPAGRITGRLVGPRGDATPDVSVEVIPADVNLDSSDWFALKTETTDAEGYFDLNYLAAGRYMVGVNLRDVPTEYNPYARAVYPGAEFEPHVIELAPGQVVDLGAWHVPAPVPEVRVAGIVTRPDGTPVAGVSVHAWDHTGQPGQRGRGAGWETSGPDGRFVLELRKGRIYRFTALGSRSRSLWISAPRIDTGERLPELIRIVVLNDPGS